MRRMREATRFGLAVKIVLMVDLCAVINLHRIQAATIEVGPITGVGAQHDRVIFDQYGDVRWTYISHRH